MSTMPRFTAPAAQVNLTERQYQGQIADLAAALGWTRRYHTTYSIGSDRGYPDLTLIHPRYGPLWLEVKGKNGRPSMEQVLWVQDIRRAGLHAYIVYPRDIELVEALLRGECGPPDRDGRPVVYLKPLLTNEERTR